MKHLRSIIVLFFVVAAGLQSYASHIVGGEIYYDCLGGNAYKITLKIYRNCYDTDLELDDPAYVFVFNAAGNFVDSLAMSSPAITTLPSVINSPCFTPPNNVCVQEGIYQQIIYLPPSPGGYDISYQRCCRNNTIVNLDNPGFTGSTYSIHIPDPALAICNSSPRFDKFPPIFLCAGIPLSFDHSATDPDGDSLHYEFCDPNDGASPLCPFFGPQGFLSTCDEIAAPPPYPSVTWLPSFSATYPIPSVPALGVNPSSGLLNGTPTGLGQYVVAICVSEYRNGNLLSTNKRDFLFNIITCDGLPFAAITQQDDFCFGYTANFSHNSINATTQYWIFGDPTTSSDYSWMPTPSWTYPGPGTYTVTLIINKGKPCPDTTTSTFNIQPKLDPSFSVQGQCLFNNNFTLNAGGAFQGNGTFLWEFSEHANITTANTPTVNNVVYDSTGSFPVTLTISENGCSEEFTGNVNVYQKPIAHYGLASPVACVTQPVHFIDSTQADSPLNYSWTFGDGSTSNESDPFHVYNTTGTYSTSLIVNSIYGCGDTADLPAVIDVYPTPEAGFSVTPMDTSIFYPEITMTDLSSGASACKVFWGDDVIYTNCDSVHSYSKPGKYRIMQVVENPSGCYDTAYSEVLIRPEYMLWIPNAFTPGRDDGLNDIFKPKAIGVSEYVFMIFDRWGKKVFETHDPSEGWNGMIGSELCHGGVYVYKISYRDDVRKDPHEFIGSVTLIR